MDEADKVAREYLKAPYSRVLIPDDETGTYTARVAEFPGCIAQGDSPEEAYRNLEVAAESWIEELLGMGEDVPEPAAHNSYSGRVALRLPKSLHRNAAQLAEREGTSLNQFLVAAIAERVGSSTTYAHLSQRLEEQVARLAAKSAKTFFGSAIGAAAQTSPDLSWHWGGSDLPLHVTMLCGLGTGATARTDQPVAIFRAEERSEANG